MIWKRKIELPRLRRRRVEPSEKPSDQPSRREASGERAGGLVRRAARRPGLPRLRPPTLRRRRDPSASGMPSGAPATPRTPGPKSGVPIPDIPLMRAFNLLPNEEMRYARVRRPSRAELALAIAGLFAIAALASLLLITDARVADKERTRDELRERAAEQAPAPRPARPAGDPALARERDERTNALAAALGSRRAWHRVLRDLALALPEDVWLKTLTGGAASGELATAAGTGSPLELTGYTYEQDGVARLLARMQVLPELDSVALVSTVTVPVGSRQVVEFAISATLKPQGAGGAA